MTTFGDVQESKIIDRLLKVKLKRIKFEVLQFSRFFFILKSKESPESHRFASVVERNKSD